MPGKLLLFERVSLCVQAVLYLTDLLAPASAGILGMHHHTQEKKYYLQQNKTNKKHTKGRGKWLSTCHRNAGWLWLPACNCGLGKWIKGTPKQAG